jgi:hypothetical protein
LKGQGRPEEIYPATRYFGVLMGKGIVEFLGRKSFKPVPTKSGQTKAFLSLRWWVFLKDIFWIDDYVK